MTATRTDYLIVGGGIVGLANAFTLAQQFPDRHITLIEKEDAVAKHQTGHNSGVIHAGVYYQPGSLKAQFCKAGVEATIAFCTRNQIPFEQCGKLLVATDAVELNRMDALYGRCIENGLEPERLSAEELKDREPNIAGVGAFFVKTTGIVDYPAMARAMARKIEAAGGAINLGETVNAIREEGDHVAVATSHKSYKASRLIVCGGLQADRLAKMAGLETDFQIVPFRGEYYRLNKRHNQVVKHLIYPIPNPELPFLGVHLTRMIDGSVTVGPNAVLGFAREGYAKGSFNMKDMASMAGYSGFWSVMKANWRSGVSEFRNSLFKSGYLKECQKYCPSLELDDLEPYPAGIRAQAVLKDGTLVHDFLIKQTDRMLHVCNAPSPAATSSLPIAGHLVQMLGNN